MEEAFAQLYQEFHQLQDLCARQAELLKKLTAKKSANFEMPISMPIQCTDAGDSERREDRISGSPGEEVHCEASAQAAPKSSHPTFPDTKHHPADCAIPLRLHNYHFLCHKTEEDRSGPGLYKQDILMNKADLGVDVGGGQQHYRATKMDAETTKVKTSPSPKPQHFPFFDLNASAEFSSFSDIYNGPHGLPSDVVSIEDGKPTGDQLGVRGPAQNSWRPTCMSEDCLLGVGAAEMNSESFGISSQTCDFCQAVFPAGAATTGEYLRHLTGHVE